MGKQLSTRKVVVTKYTDKLWSHLLMTKNMGKSDKEKQHWLRKPSLSLV